VLPKLQLLREVPPELEACKQSCGNWFRSRQRRHVRALRLRHDNLNMARPAIQRRSFLCGVGAPIVNSGMTWFSTASITCGWTPRSAILVADRAELRKRHRGSLERLRDSLVKLLDS
jgi:hypothetical protein